MTVLTQTVAELVRLLRRHVADMPVLVVDLDEQARYGRRRWYRQKVCVGGEWHLYEVRWVGKLEHQDPGNG